MARAELLYGKDEAMKKILKRIAAGIYLEADHGRTPKHRHRYVIRIRTDLCVDYAGGGKGQSCMLQNSVLF